MYANGTEGTLSQLSFSPPFAPFPPRYHSPCHLSEIPQRHRECFHPPRQVATFRPKLASSCFSTLFRSSSCFACSLGNTQLRLDLRSTRSTKGPRSESFGQPRCSCCSCMIRNMLYLMNPSHLAQKQGPDLQNCS